MVGGVVGWWGGGVVGWWGGGSWQKPPTFSWQPFLGENPDLGANCCQGMSQVMQGITPPKLYKEGVWQRILRKKGEKGVFHLAACFAAATSNRLSSKQYFDNLFKEKRMEGCSCRPVQECIQSSKTSDRQLPGFSPACFSWRG